MTRERRPSPPACDLLHVDPRQIATAADLARQLDRLRIRAASPGERGRVTLERLAASTGIPRSTVHAYVSGLRLPGSSSLDLIVAALGASAQERSSWAGALERVLDGDPGPVVDQVPAEAVGEPEDPMRQPPAPDDETVRVRTAVPRQLPARPARFTGREHEAARLDEGVAGVSNRPAVVALTGTGGIGKTSLVLAWAHDRLEAFPDGQLWVDLCGFGPTNAIAPTDALERLIRALGAGTAELPADVDARASLFRTIVAGRRLLVVLDNARDTAQVTPLLAGTPGVVTVVTSRDALRSLVVGGGAARVQLDRLSLDASLEMLCSGLPESAAAAIGGTEIAPHCEGLPLALAIVRERLSMASFVDVVEFADDLRRGRLSALDLHDSVDDISVRGALAWSYRALPADAARCFRLLPLCLRPRVDVDCVAALLGADIPTTRTVLDRLAAASLIEPAGRDRFRIHDLVTAFAAECTPEDDPEVVLAARTRLIDHLMLCCERVDADHRATRVLLLPHPRARDVHADPPFRDTEQANAWILEHADVVDHAMREALERGALADATALAERAFRALFVRGDVSRFETTFVRLIQAVGDDRRAEMVLKHCLGLTIARGGRLTEAAKHMQRVIDLAAEAGEPLLGAVELSNLGLVWTMTGELTRGGEALAAAYADLVGNGGPINPTVQSLVHVELQRGDLDAAERWVVIGLASSAAFPAADYDRLWSDLDAIRFQLAAGRIDAARSLLARVEEKFRDASSTEVVGRIDLQQSMLQRATGNLAAAEAAARTSLATARTLGSREQETDAIVVLADVVRQQGRHEEALQLLEVGLSRARDGDLRYAECQMLIVAGHTQLALGRPEAPRTYESARRIATRCGYRPLLAELNGRV